LLDDRGIAFHPEHRVSRIDGTARKVFFDGAEASYDLLVGVPPHKAPRVVEEAGLTDATGYVPTHPETLEILADPETLTTRYPGVFAIGDITAVRLLNALFLPKAGVFVEAEARVVAQNIAAAVGGRGGLARFDGRGFCYVEVGEGMAAFGSGNFYEYPGPSVALEPPSAQYRRDKEEFERVLDTWFTR
jgi:sulfide:quinone oxidoreductase